MSSHRVLVRYRVSKLSKGQMPYHKDEDGDYVTNRMPVYVQRVKGKPMNVRLTPEHGYTGLVTTAELDRIDAVADERGWDLDVRRSDLVIPRYRHLDGDLDCNVDLLDRLDRVGDELGETVFVRSGKRTMDEQWALYNKLGPTIAAYPSPSAPHVRGIAADCGIDGVNIGAVPGARRAMLKHGLCLRVANENWHVEVGARERWAPNWLP